tara:strand:- start:30535 stop:31263 length:729 start_codon:yes stop_codon:yes gene_type:complete
VAELEAESESYALTPGRILGRNYRVLDYLGNGWEGEVYKVEECRTGIIRAAKLFYKHCYKITKPHIFYAKKLNKLRSCPIIIQYHNQDVVTVRKEKVDFLISDYVSGEVLSEFVAKQKNKKLNPFEALNLFYALVQGVEHIHFQGEYHGDLHADNIMIQRKGLSFEVKLIDFLHLGRPTKLKIQEDVYDLIGVFYDMLGGQKHYKDLPANIKGIILGRKKNLIAKKFKMAGHLRLYLENLTW